MSVHERLRRVIERERGRLRAGVPADRRAATVAVVRARDRLADGLGDEVAADLVSGRRLADPGGNEALRLCLEGSGDGPAAAVAVVAVAADGAEPGPDGWAERFLAGCGRLAEAEQVAAHGEGGFMRLAESGDDGFAAWIAAKRAPPSWRERAEIDWWASWLAERRAPGFGVVRSGASATGGGDNGIEARCRRLADGYLARMDYQFGYPPDAVIDGCSVRTYRGVLARLIGRALRGRERGEAAVPQVERALVAAIAGELGVESAVVGRAVAGFTLDRAGAAYHAAVPGVAAAPLVRLDGGGLVWSVHGLTTEPLLFLGRELRRRAAAEYHNSAHLREGVFRQDLYALFADKRFVTGAGRIALRGAGGDVRTDVDAVVFDRKTGTLGLFELKSHDPFPRSAAELARRRDNLLYANRQLSGVLDWVKRHGADALLGRVDARTAKTFRVQKVYPFVLSRSLVPFGDGPEPDRRAAWGTWPRVLMLTDGRPFGAADANPLASLFARLTKEEPPSPPAVEAAAREIVLGEGEVRLTVYSSYAAFRASVAN